VTAKEGVLGDVNVSRQPYNAQHFFVPVIASNNACSFIHCQKMALVPYFSQYKPMTKYYEFIRVTINHQHACTHKKTLFLLMPYLVNIDV
jgi:hypothetical protein